MQQKHKHMVQFHYITTQEQLQEACNKLQQEKELAIDLECENNLHHYGTFISLIQISTPKENYIIDILKLKTIPPLVEIFHNKNILKIFHDVSFDLRVLNYQFKCKPKNIYDTQLASLLLGKEHIGLGPLLETYFNIKKQKKFQRVDWTKRPLSEEMLAYAVKDTAYLLQLKQKLVNELQQQNRLNWLEQELQLIEQTEYPYKEQTYIDLPHVKNMHPRQRALVHKLFDERNKLAKKADRPAFMIFSNKQLLLFAQQPPKNWKTLSRVHPLVKRNAEHFQIIVKKTLQGPGEPYHKPKRTRSAPISKQKIQELNNLRNKIAEKFHIKSHLLLSYDQIKAILTEKNLSSLRKWQQNILKTEPLIKSIIKNG